MVSVRHLRKQVLNSALSGAAAAVIAALAFGIRRRMEVDHVGSMVTVAMFFGLASGAIAPAIGGALGWSVGGGLACGMAGSVLAFVEHFGFAATVMFGFFGILLGGCGGFWLHQKVAKD